MAGDVSPVAMFSILHIVSVRQRALELITKNLMLHQNFRLATVNVYNTYMFVNFGREEGCHCQAESY